MSLYTESEAKALLDKVLKLSKGDQTTATLTGQIAGNVRFARNSVSTSGEVQTMQLAVQVSFGKKVGIATIGEFDDAALERVVRRAEELAQLAPENPEFMPLVPKQEYKATPTFVEATTQVTPEFRAQVAADCIEPCQADKLVAAGFFNDTQKTLRSAFQPPRCSPA